MSWSDANAKHRWYTLFPLSQQSAGLTDQDAAKRYIQRRGGRFDARQPELNLLKGTG
jgi:hypothetical protein